MTTPATVTVTADTARDFITAFGDAHTIQNLAHTMTCSEVNVLIELLTELGAPVTAEQWTREHRDADDIADTPHH